MPLQKQPVDISFAQGVDTKTDPKRVPIGRFLSLQNTQFTKAGLLQKRNGFASLPAVPVENTTFLGTFNGDLTAIGSSIYAFNTANQAWVNKANLLPCELSTLPLVRSNTNQTQADSVIAPNGLVCTVYTDQNPANLAGSTVARYVIADSVTGQNIVEPTTLTEADSTYGTPRVFLLGNYFVILYTQNSSGTYLLRYTSISSIIPSYVIAPQSIQAGAVTPGQPLTFDAYAYEQRLYVAYSNAASAQSLVIVYLQNLAAGPSNPLNFAGYYPSQVSVTSDGTYIYVSWYDTNATYVYAAACDLNLNLVLSPFLTNTSLGVTALAITSTAVSGTLTQYIEVNDDYPNGAPSHYVATLSLTLSPLFHSVFASGATSITVSSANGLSDGAYLVDNTTPSNLLHSGSNITISNVSGTTLTLSHTTAGNSASSPGDSIIAVTLGTLTTVLRGVGLASKAFLLSGEAFLLVAFNTPYQPTFFLINVVGKLILAKLAYSNAGALPPLTVHPYLIALPNISLTGNVVSIPYLRSDAVQGLNKNNGALNDVTGIYTQSGINLATFTIGTSSVSASEAANTLSLSGGFVWSYDGYTSCEQGFHVWPDYVGATFNSSSAHTATADAASSSYTITSISINTSGLVIGMTVADSTNSTYIQAGTIITAILSSSSVLISLPTTHAISGDTLSFQANISALSDGENDNAYYYQAIYSWSDNQGNQYVSAPSIPVGVTTTGSGTANTITVRVSTLRLTAKLANPVKIQIYRWSIAQPVYYEVTTPGLPLLNSTSVDYLTFTDVYADSAILGNDIIYTTGGVLEDIGPPATSLITLFQTRQWLVDAEDPNLLWYSKQIIEGTPIEYSDLLTYYVAPSIGAQGSTGPVTALAPMDDKLILFKYSLAGQSGTGIGMYYINGTGPDNTGANSQFSEPTFITSVIGCNNQQSIVFIPSGLMFQNGNGNIWLLGRDLSTQYIGAPVESYTQGVVVNSAINIPGTTQVRFMLDSGITLMYDYFYAQWAVYTVNGVSSTVYQGLHTYVNAVGDTFQESPGVYLDGTSPVLMSFTTAWISLAGLQGYERFYQCYLLGDYITPFKLNCSFSFDYNPALSESHIVTPQAYEPPWGGDALWGSGSTWGGASQVFSERVFPDQQKCETFSMTVNELYDASYGVPAGAGLTLLGLNLIVGVKRGFRTQSAGKSS